jgi:hypothetical protein
LSQVGVKTQVLPRERPGQARSVEPRSAAQLERPGRAATFGEIGSLEQAHAGIDQRRIDGGHVGRGHHPRKARLAVEHLAAPAFHRDDLEVAPDAASTLLRRRVEQPRAFARGEAMPGGDGPQAHERFEPRMHHATFHRGAADGVRPVEHKEPQLVPRRRPHGEAHGGEVRVVAAADVLHVEDERVEAPQVLVPRRERGEVLAVQRMLGDARARIDRGADLLQVLHVPAHAVLRTEERGERHARRLVQQIREVAQLGIDAGRVEDGADPQPLEKPRLQHPRDARLHHQYAFRERNPPASVRARMRRSSSNDQCSM